MAPGCRREDRALVRILGIIDLHSSYTSHGSKKLAARLLGLLSKCLDAHEVQVKVLHRTLRLGEDESSEVRGMVVETLETMCLSLPLEVMEVFIWRQVARLIKVSAEEIMRVSSLCEVHRTIFFVEKMLIFCASNA